MEHKSNYENFPFHSNMNLHYGFDLFLEITFQTCQLKRMQNGFQTPSS